MLTEFQDKKMRRLFELYDMDGDGFINQDDFTRRAEAFAAANGWSQDSKQYRDQLAFTLKDWEGLAEADTDGDGKVTLEEFMSYANVLLNDSTLLEEFVDGDASSVFAAMDTDEDGQISPDEYKTYLSIYDVPADHADTLFDRLDLDGDGYISATELRAAVRDFVLSDDPKAPGNFLFGPLD